MNRKFIMLFDGTWNNSISRTDEDTNIYALNLSISPAIPQTKFYIAGVGEHVGEANRNIHGILGKGVFSKCREAWSQISSNYQDGDEIFIFGFSRGAFAAKHLASMITRYGLKAYKNRIEDGFDEYVKNIREKTFPIKAYVKFLGLFDCVPGNQIYQLKDNNKDFNSQELNGGIQHFRHAVSMHERRKSFKPLIFKENGQESFKQHWFPGVHSDVGGGKDISNELSSFSLWWMIREAYGLGLEFENIGCNVHKYGNALGVIQSINPEAKPSDSDYITTKAGLSYNRIINEIDPKPNQLLKFEDMDECPRCGKDMFDFFATPYGKSKLNAMGFNK